MKRGPARQLDYLDGLIDVVSGPLGMSQVCKLCGWRSRAKWRRPIVEHLTMMHPAECEAARREKEGRGGMTQ